MGTTGFLSLRGADQRVSLYNVTSIYGIASLCNASAPRRRTEGSPGPTGHPGLLSYEEIGVMLKLPQEQSGRGSSGPETP